MDTAAQDKKECIISKIDTLSLNGWNNGYVVNEHMYICEFTDSTTSNTIGIIGDFDCSDNLIVTVNDGYLQTICTSTETFYFIYNGTDTKILMADNAGNIEDVKQTQMHSIKRVATQNDITPKPWLEQLQDFLNNYADKLSTSDSPFLRNQAEELRNLPENLIKDGLIKGLAKLTGKKIPFAKEILDMLERYDKERSVFGQCRMTVLGVTKTGTDYYINAKLDGFDGMPNYGDIVQSVTGGVVCRYTKVSDTWNKPTTSYNDYKWEHNYKGNFDLTEKLPEMNLGWYEFRPYVTRAGVTKYGNLYSFLYSELKESPVISVSNNKCTYLGNDKFKVEFDCSFVPLENEGLLYQGLELSTGKGDKVVSFGAGTTHEKVSETMSADNFTISGTTATLNLKVQYWYVTRYSSETFFKDLEDSVSVKYSEQPSVKFTSAHINGTEKDSTRYTTGYSFEYEATGTFWIDRIQYTIVQDNWNNYWDAQTLNADGKYSASGFCEYDASSMASHQTYYTIYLKMGGVSQSSNSLYFSGNPISNVYISGGRNISRGKNKIEKGKTLSDNRLINMKKK